MAKYNMFLGTAKGSVGDVTMYRFGGNQCARVRVREISNPKSEGQQIQRSIAATVMQAYSALKSICNHSWENTPYKLKSMAKFNKLNMDLIRSLYSVNYGLDNSAVYLTAPNVSTFVPNPYKISSGSLTSKFTVTNVGNDKGSIGIQNNEIISGTLGERLASLGLLKPRSVVTLVYSITKTGQTALYTGGDDSGAKLYPSDVYIYRVVRTEEAIPDDLADAEYSSDNVAKLDDYFKNAFSNATPESNPLAYHIIDILLAGMSDITTTPTDILPGAEEETNYVSSAAIINSRYENESWLRSTETMVVNPNVQFGLSAYYAQIAWTDGVTTVGDTDYLLNASALETAAS